MNLWLMLLLHRFRETDRDDAPSSARSRNRREKRLAEDERADDIGFDDGEPETQREGLFRRSYEQRGKA